MDEKALPELDLGDFLKDVVWGAVVKVATARLIAALPFLGWGPMGWITAGIVAVVGNVVYEAMEEAFNLQKIVFKNDGFQKAYDTVSVKLKIIAHNYGVDSEEFKAARRANLLALQQLAKFD